MPGKPKMVIIAGPLLWVAIANDYCTLQVSVKRILLRGSEEHYTRQGRNPLSGGRREKSATQLMFAALTFR